MTISLKKSKKRTAHEMDDDCDNSICPEKKKQRLMVENKNNNFEEKLMKNSGFEHKSDQKQFLCLFKSIEKTQLVKSLKIPSVIIVEIAKYGIGNFRICQQPFCQKQYHITPGSELNAWRDFVESEKEYGSFDEENEDETALGLYCCEQHYEIRNDERYQKCPGCDTPFNVNSVECFYMEGLYDCTFICCNEECDYFRDKECKHCGAQYCGLSAHHYVYIDQDFYDCVECGKKEFMCIHDQLEYTDMDAEELTSCSKCCNEKGEAVGWFCKECKLELVCCPSGSTHKKCADKLSKCDICATPMCWGCKHLAGRCWECCKMGPYCPRGNKRGND